MTLFCPTQSRVELMYDRWTLCKSPAIDSSSLRSWGRTNWNPLTYAPHSSHHCTVTGTVPVQSLGRISVNSTKWYSGHLKILRIPLNAMSLTCSAMPYISNQATGFFLDWFLSIVISISTISTCIVFPGSRTHSFFTAE